MSRCASATCCSSPPVTRRIRRSRSTAIGHWCLPTKPLPGCSPGSMQNCWSRRSMSCVSACIPPEWRGHLLERLRRQIEVSGDAVLARLMAELRAYPVPGVRATKPAAEANYAAVLIPFRLVTEHGVLSFFSTTTVFGTPVDITVSELALESFFPADAATAQLLGRRGGRQAEA